MKWQVTEPGRSTATLLKKFELRAWSTSYACGYALLVAPKSYDSVDETPLREVIVLHQQKLAHGLAPLEEIQQQAEKWYRGLGE